MKKVTLLIIVLMLAFVSISPQNRRTLKQDNKGNYIERTTTKSRQGKETRRTYTNSKGTTYKVYEESTGKRFIWLMDKNNRYTKYYIR